jgi:predicted ATPase
VATPPTGTCAFLFTDIEGSTRQWEQHPDAMHQSLELHDAIMREEIAAKHGYVFSTAGDSFAVAFQEAANAVEAARSIQTRLAECRWPKPVIVRVRMGIHVGASNERAGDYFGSEVNRSARLMSAAHGGQTVISERVRLLLPHLDVIDHGEHTLKDLSATEHVFEVDSGQPHEPFPPLRTLDRRRIRLPIQATPLLGRETERAAIAERLKSHRLVTLRGLGGMGKTRLSIHVGAEVAHRFADGVNFVELAPVGDPGAVPFALTDSLGIRVTPGVQPLDAAIAALGDRTQLLILDNCEHVIETVRDLVRRLLTACPEVRVVTTSRVGLDLDGEIVYQLDPLGLGSADSAAVKLFIERAQAANPDLEFDGERVACISTLCDHLDGVPLAIVLAAARCRSMTPEDIAAHLDDRFQLLSARGGVEERHRRLRDVLEWSYDRLEPEHQLLFQRMSVFAGQCSLESIRAVCGDDDLDAFGIVDGLEALVDQSLLMADVGRSRTRYGMLETIREFGLDQLVNRDEVRLRHADHFVDAGTGLMKAMLGANEGAAREELSRVWDDLRAAWWFANETGNVELAAGVVAQLAFEVLWRQRLEASEWARATIGLPGFGDLAAVARVGVLATAASGMLSGAEAPVAAAHLSTIVDLVDNTPPRDISPSVLGATSVHFFIGELVGGVELCERLLEHIDQTETRARHVLLTSGSSMLGYAGDHERSVEWAEAAIGLGLTDPAPTWDALARWNAARFAGTKGAAMIAVLDDVIAAFTTVGNEFGAAAARRHLVALHDVGTGLIPQLSEIAGALRDADLSEARNAIGWMLTAAIELLEVGDFHNAAPVLAWQDQHRVAPIQPLQQERLDRSVPEMERVLDAKTLAQLQADGAALALVDIVEVAIVGIESALERLSADGQSRPG